MDNSMKIALLGSQGQLGKTVLQTVPEGIEVTPFSRHNFDLLDIDAALLAPFDGVINCAAYTAVDQAETDQTNAYGVNRDAIEQLARICKHKAFTHISTDFVFAGNQSRAYQPDDNIDPQSVYGDSKAQGEALLFKHHPNALCIRTSWVYAAEGNNFVNTMIRLMNEREQLNVVNDQVGSPTATTDLAEAIWQLHGKASGLWHYSNQGLCSWYDFAMAIYHLGSAKGLITSPCNIRPIATSGYPTPAKRPAFSLLDKTKTEQQIGEIPHWLISLDKVLSTLQNN